MEQGQAVGKSGAVSSKWSGGRWLEREKGPDLGHECVGLECLQVPGGRCPPARWLGAWEWAEEEMSVRPRETVFEAMGVSDVTGE